MRTLKINLLITYRIGGLTMEKPIVKVSNLSKSYSLYKKKSDRLLEMFSFKKGEQFLALSDISFEVFKGETIGIIGINGSGKSTLSSILAQIIPPTTGRIEVTGEVSLVAISAGLNNQLTGMENIELKCLMHGLTKEEINEVTPLIIDFADIGDFIHQPIKSYSSGMRSRLGFSISIFINPDILVIDEALSVGDSTFYQKCLNVFDDYQKQGKTIFFISHSLSQVKKISDKILWINFGRVEMFDSTEKVAKKYEEFIKRFNKMSKTEQKNFRSKMLGSQKELNEQRKGQENQELISREEMYHQARTLRRRKIGFVAQLLFIMTLFISSIFFLFTDNRQEAKNIDSSINEENVTKIDSQQSVATEKNEEPTVINEKALIIEPDTPIYEEEDQKKVLKTIPFGTDVVVLTEQEDTNMYGFELDDEQVYIQKEKVKLITDIDDNSSVMQFSQINHLFPQEFIESYMFLLDFINEEKVVVQNSLQGITSEHVDGDLGLSLIEYDYVKTTYLFDEDDRAQMIKVSDMNIDSNDEVEDIVGNAFIRSEDETHIGVLVDKYLILFDRDNSSALVKENSFSQ